MKHRLLRLFKSATLNSKKHVKYKFWQNEYHPVELFSNEMLEYVHDTPVKEGIVDKPEDYHSSARDLCRRGLLEIELMD